MYIYKLICMYHEHSCLHAYHFSVLALKQDCLATHSPIVWIRALYVCVSVCFCLFLSLSFFLSLSVPMFVSMFVSMSVSMFVSLSVSVPVPASVSQSRNHSYQMLIDIHGEEGVGQW